MSDRKRKSRYPATVAALLAETFRGKPLEKRLDEAEIWRVWEEAVGPQVAAQARPSRFRDGVLTVMVASAPWMQQLNFMKRDIADQLNRKLGKSLVGEIYLKAGRAREEERRAPAEKPAVRPLTEEEIEKVRAAVEVISDPELRRAFAELLEKQLSSTPGKPR